MELKDAAVVARVGMNLCNHKIHVLDDHDLRRLPSEYQTKASSYIRSSLGNKTVIHAKLNKLHCGTL